MADFKTIGQISAELNIEPHVIRYWETQFPQIKPVKRRGGRRYYRDVDAENLEKIYRLLHIKGYTIKGAKKALTLENQAFMAKTVKPDIDTLDMFGGVAVEKPLKEKPAKKAKAAISAEKETLQKVLTNLKEIQKIISA